MSIIQEALQRRAEEEAAKSGALPPPSVRSAPRRESRPPSSRERPANAPGRGRGLFLLLALLAVVGIGFAFFSRRPPPAKRGPAVAEASPGAGGTAGPETIPGTEAPRPDAAGAVAPAPPDSEPPPAGAAEAVPAAGGDAETPPGAGPAPSAAIPAPPPEPWPALELQGVVLRRPPHPSAALINGRRLRVGESIEGARLLAVEEEQVRLEFRGGQRTLSVGERWE